MKKLFASIASIVVFLVGMALIVSNQKIVSLNNLALMILGLFMLLGLIYVYNRKYQ